MQRLKIVFSGPMGAGKTQAISSLSDIPVVSTEVKNTDLQTNAKALTTVGMDYGELTILRATRLLIWQITLKPLQKSMMDVS